MVNGEEKLLLPIYHLLFTIYHWPVSIHPTAVVSPRAAVAAGVRVGPFAVIEDGVGIGEGCEVGAQPGVKRFTTRGPRNRFSEHAIVGGEPQDVKFKGEASRLEIGDDNLIREY